MDIILLTLNTRLFDSDVSISQCHTMVYSNLWQCSLVAHLCLFQQKNISQAIQFVLQVVHLENGEDT